MSMACLATTF